jgi:hypothetical protein
LIEHGRELNDDVFLEDTLCSIAKTAGRFDVEIFLSKRYPSLAPKSQKTISGATAKSCSIRASQGARNVFLIAQTFEEEVMPPVLTLLSRITDNIS